MKVDYKKRSFYKFFFLYFISVAILILVSGRFYFQDKKNTLLRVQEYSLIDYARTIKQNKDTSKYKNFHYVIIKNNKNIDITNFQITDKFFIKILPMKLYDGYVKVYKSNDQFLKYTKNLSYKIFALQFILLMIFALISYFLAKNALKPLEESINTLDKFIKDLIHDLNTPVTSINLNLNLLKNTKEYKKNKALLRIEKSINNISNLYANLNTILQEKTFQYEKFNLCYELKEIALAQKELYPNINLDINCDNLVVYLNKNAFNRILLNLISNSFKHNKPNGYVKIYIKDEKLYICNSGPNIVEPDVIFNRGYSGINSSGIGLDIVKRLSDAMNIKVEVAFEDGDNYFILEFT